MDRQALTIGRQGPRTDRGAGPLPCPEGDLGGESAQAVPAILASGRLLMNRVAPLPARSARRSPADRWPGVSGRFSIGAFAGSCEGLCTMCVPVGLMEAHARTERTPIGPPLTDGAAVGRPLEHPGTRERHGVARVRQPTRCRPAFLRPHHAPRRQSESRRWVGAPASRRRSGAARCAGSRKADLRAVPLRCVFPAPQQYQRHILR